MGKRGPPPDPHQAAKGFPGRRKSKAQKALEAAERVAQLLSAAPAAGNDPYEPPLLLEPMFAPALTVWRELAPELKRTHRLPRESRMVFIQLCVYTAEWFASQMDIAANGPDQRVKTVAGGYMERERPVYRRRERAFDNVLKLSERFGLTPSDLYAIFKDQAIAASQNPTLFDRPGQAPGAPAPSVVEPEAEAPRPPGLIGRLGALDSTPPGSRPN